MRPASAPLYLDTSCLLKLFFREPESARVAECLTHEENVLVSELARLEAETQLRARQLGGWLTRSRQARLAAALQKLLVEEPFTVVEVPRDSFERARTLSARASVHARTLDLLHVATMEALRVTRLFTNDVGQASVCRALGFDVTMP